MKEGFHHIHNDLSDKVCLDCGHKVCPGCGNWCDMIATTKEDLKTYNINYQKAIIEGDRTKEPFNPNDENEFPVLCCEGECRYE